MQASKKECTRLQELVDSLKTDEKKTNAAKEELDRKLCASQKAETSLKVSNNFDHDADRKILSIVNTTPIALHDIHITCTQGTCILLKNATFC